MYRGLIVAVVVPAFNEEVAVGATVRSVPGFVDYLLVVDDASRDATFRAASRLLRRRGRRGSEVLRHEQNRGVGGAIVTGYQRALGLGADVVAVMAGDGQMDPADLPRLLDPIVDGRCDYAKGNRFAQPEVWRVMPPLRLCGNVILSLLTKLTSGYLHVFDSQCGYTAASRQALQSIDLDEMFPRYGYVNDLLARFATAGQRVLDVPVRPIYGPTWHSGISIATAIYPISFVLLRSWGRRLASRFVRLLAPPRRTPDEA